MLRMDMNVMINLDMNVENGYKCNGMATNVDID